MTVKPALRCAIYTRKSSDEGLEQEFNSLDAQAEACAAYIASQRHEGWKLVSNRYDDGGLSGGTLERPALQRLLADIAARRVDMIVVYKIDRLTRSLADFARLVERLEAAGASFVSVTQAFNTSTSMGRLTLNVLLSFAQFEREVTAERIRDRIAASKQKGLWMGGNAPLGYDPHPDRTRRELVVNPAEAETVLALYRLYEELGCLSRVEAEATRRGLMSKRRVSAAGLVRGGGPFSRGQLHHLFTNPTYLGRIRHKDKTFPGQHPAIVPEGLWTRVQEKLALGSARKRGQAKEDNTASALLTGLFRDETGDRLTPTHCRKAGRRHHYYVSNRLIAGGPDPSAWRLPARAFEALIAGRIAHHLERAADRHTLLAAPDPATAAPLRAGIADLVRRFRAPGHRPLSALIAEGRIARDRLTINLDGKALAEALNVDADAIAPDLLVIEAPLALRRRGVETRLMSGALQPAPDRILIRALAQAHRWAALLREGRSFLEIARGAAKDESLVRARTQLAYLAPTIQTRVLAGTLPPDLTLERLMRLTLPLAWDDQIRTLGL